MPHALRLPEDGRALGHARLADSPERAAAALASQAFAMETPIEEWLQRLSEIARDESDAEEFLEAAMRAFVSLPGVRGAAWKTAAGGDSARTRGACTSGRRW